MSFLNFEKSLNMNKDSGMKDSVALDESGIAAGAIQSGLEFVGDKNPRYDNKVVISAAQNSIW